MLSWGYRLWSDLFWRLFNGQAERVEPHGQVYCLLTSITHKMHSSAEQLSRLSCRVVCNDKAPSTANMSVDHHHCPDLGLSRNRGKPDLSFDMTWPSAQDRSALQSELEFFGFLQCLTAQHEFVLTDSLERRCKGSNLAYPSWQEG